MSYKIRTILIVCAMLAATLSGCAETQTVNEESIQTEPVQVTEEVETQPTEKEFIVMEDTEEW